MKFFLSSVSFLIFATSPATAFNNALFQQAPTAQQTFPSKTDGVEIEHPDFDELFGRAQQVSPLSRVAIEGYGYGLDRVNVNGAKKGFEAVDKSCKSTEFQHHYQRLLFLFCLS
jgi:hypothetical protein